MYPSYPSYVRHTDLSIRFAVPNTDVVKNILQHCEDDDNLRRKAAGNILYPRIQRLARIMSRHRIQLDTISTNELGITLFLPPPPCPPPKTTFRNLFPRFRRQKIPDSKLETINEESEAENEELYRKARVQFSSTEWITLYEYLPVDKRHAVYVAPGEGNESIRLHV
ncbi:uncharacterized protein K460DRAFT_437145 [Cucurbitaria berberidis CBS 394.84]|uniref:Uncharacterized protein n=1 Tax=Cucurbitaria berberidis CBS 394.84 TaxID=1168544 RepID=A0A9P4G6Z8_9PLEO|nr:uncharacterized protein K460DRAFT_437145 [Cucurbitaria berberidis CBS 394.84]KAF1840102.1 hypothetical protein K460DRAFT_437145 [Cucurbitaria berberidis CBS 394.84]